MNGSRHTHAWCATRRLLHILAAAVAFAFVAGLGPQNVSARASDASEAARAVIDAGPYQRTFPGELDNRKRPPRRSGDGGAPRWRLPRDLPARGWGDSASGAVTAVLIVVGIIGGLGLLAGGTLRIRAWLRKPRAQVIGEVEEEIAPPPPPPSAVDAVIAEAQALFGSGLGEEAVLLLWRQSVVISIGKDPSAPGTDRALTGREVVAGIAATGRSGPTQLGGLRSLLGAMEKAWFGKLAVTEDQLVTCIEAFRRVATPPASGAAP